MKDDKTLEILKQAILLERRGKIFYANIAKQAEDEGVKNFFELMAKEEELHINILTEQYMLFKNKKSFNSNDLPSPEELISDEILSKDIKEKISAASFEAAAIQAAIDMENRAVEIYSERAENAEDIEEKKFYEWLANWEKGHNQLLIKIDKELKEEIWDDNKFWPF